MIKSLIICKFQYIIKKLNVKNNFTFFIIIDFDNFPKKNLRENLRVNTRKLTRSYT